MNKFFLLIFFTFFLGSMLAPAIIMASSPGDYDIIFCGPIMPDKAKGAAYTLNDFFDVLTRLYRFITTCVAAPLATIALIVSGIILLASAGNSNLQGLGRKMLWASIIGLVLALGSWVIVNALLTILGVKVE